MVMGPENAADVQALVTARLDALSSLPDVQQTATIEWRGLRRSLPVIDVPIGLVSYNPDTHRIRAQRSLDPGKEQALIDQPFGEVAQNYLRDLLKGAPEDPAREDPTFTALKESLDAHGQEEPGIITRSGVLVNGNTRCAALRELGADSIRVAVLPPDAGEDDIRTVELALQMRKDFKREYSFVNFLLAVDERVAAGHSAGLIMTDFRIRRATFDRAMWILSFIREALDRSKHVDGTGTVAQLRLVDFETDQGKLEELHRAYSSLRPKDPDAADALREQRLLALALDKSKTDLRLIDQGFAAAYLVDKLPEPPADTPTRTIPGTSIPVMQPNRELQRLKALADEALQAKAVATAPSGKVSDSARVTANARVQELSGALDAALDKAGRNARLKQRKVAPADRITDAVEDLNLAVQAIAEARAVGQFDADDIDDALTVLRGSVERLAQLVRLTDSDSSPDGAGLGDGISWLLAAAVAD